MRRTEPVQTVGFGIYCRTKAAMAAILFAIALAIVPPAMAQTLTVLHAFGSMTDDGANPESGLTMDAQGNFYGTASSGGNVGGSCGNGCGTVFELKREGSGFIYRPLYSFEAGNDGADPETGVPPVARARSSPGSCSDPSARSPVSAAARHPAGAARAGGSGRLTPRRRHTARVARRRPDLRAPSSSASTCRSRVRHPAAPSIPGRAPHRGRRRAR